MWREFRCSAGRRTYVRGETTRRGTISNMLRIVPPLLLAMQLCARPLLCEAEGGGRGDPPALLSETPPPVKWVQGYVPTYRWIRPSLQLFNPLSVASNCSCYKSPTHSTITLYER
jgi:hypothetical protein